MDGRNRRTRPRGRVQHGQMENRGADAGAGHPAGQPAAGDLLGDLGLRVAAGCRCADAVVHGPLPVGRLAAPA